MSDNSELDIETITQEIFAAGFIMGFSVGVLFVLLIAIVS